MKECSKSIQRRLSDSNFMRRYFAGHGLDIGGKPDPLSLYVELFPQIKSVKTWDWEDGDAQFLATVKEEGLRHWFRAVKQGGHMVITVPDEDLYEQGVFPSTFNRDHKWTFTIFKNKSWSDHSLNILDMVRQLGAQAEVLKIEQLSATYRFDLPRFDQTLTPVAECGIELIIRKRTHAEVEAGGRWVRPMEMPDREMRLHLNQYKDDMQRMKQSNTAGRPPFENDSPL
jgi:SAM-dependent methyltransferase